MSDTIVGVVHSGRIDLLEGVDLPEGARVLVTLLPDDDEGFWARASQSSLDQVWDNAEDDVYSELLAE